MTNLLRFLLKGAIIFLTFFLIFPITIKAQTQNSDTLPTDTLTPVFKNHNDIRADRINLIFIFGEGYDNQKNLAKQNFIQSLQWNGNPIVYRDIFNKPRLEYGVFSIEPLKSNKNKFNLWFADDGFIYPQLEEMSNVTMIFFERQDNPTVLASATRVSQGNSFIYDPTILGLYYEEVALPVILRRLDDENNLALNSIILVYEDYTDPTQISRHNRTLTHELGHAIFDLADEYKAYGSLDAEKFSYNYSTNCKINQEEAQEDWQNLVGRIDPFVFRVIQDYRRILRININKDGLTLPDSTFNQNIHQIYDRERVSFLIGCLNGSSIMPTRNSIMNNRGTHFPNWGAVNRKQVEQILAVFEG